MAVRQRAAAERSQRDSQSAQATAKLDAQFQADAKLVAAKQMTPIEFSRKYDRMRGRLPSASAAALQAIEKQIN
jgi:hypothetical protein